MGLNMDMQMKQIPMLQHQQFWALQRTAQMVVNFCLDEAEQEVDEDIQEGIILKRERNTAVAQRAQTYCETQGMRWLKEMMRKNSLFPLFKARMDEKNFRGRTPSTRGILDMVSEADLNVSLILEMNRALCSRNMGVDLQEDLERVRRAEFRRLTPADLTQTQRLYDSAWLKPEVVHGIAEAVRFNEQDGVGARRRIRVLQERIRRGVMIWGYHERPREHGPTVAEQMARIGERAKYGESQFIGYGLMDGNEALCHFFWEQTPQLPNDKYCRDMLGYLHNGITGAPTSFDPGTSIDMFRRHPERILRLELIISRIRFAACRTWAEVMQLISGNHPTIKDDDIPARNGVSDVTTVVFERLGGFQIFQKTPGGLVLVPTHELTSNIGDNLSSLRFTAERNCTNYGVNFSEGGPYSYRRFHDYEYAVNPLWRQMWGRRADVRDSSVLFYENLLRRSGDDHTKAAGGKDLPGSGEASFTTPL